MKVLIISPYFFPYKGVGAIRMSSLAAYLLSKKIEVFVARLNNFHDANIELPKSLEGITFIDIPEKSFNDNLLIKLESILTINKIERVLVSVGPYYTLKLVHILTSKFRLKVIIDFRDLWIFEERRQDLFRFLIKKFSLIFSYLTELRALVSAKSVIFVTEGDLNIMSFFYSFLKKKFFLIPNGHDFEQYTPETIESSPSQQSIISVFGKFTYYDRKSALLFLKGINNFQLDFKVIHYGEKEDVIDVHSIYNDIYHYYGYISYISSIKMMKESKINLIVYPLKSGLGTKVYDYIYANKPILLIGSRNSAIFKLLNNFKNFYFLDHRFPEKWNFDFLLNLPNELDTNLQSFLYSRKKSNNKFVELININ